MERILILAVALLFLTPVAHGVPPPEHIEVKLEFSDGQIIKVLVPEEVGDFTYRPVQAIVPVGPGDVAVGALVIWGQHGHPLAHGIVFDFKRRPRILLVISPHEQRIWIYREGVPRPGTTAESKAELDKMEAEASQLRL